MLTVLLLLIFVPLAFLIGELVGRRRSIDYKGRWQEATALIQHLTDESEILQENEKTKMLYEGSLKSYKELEAKVEEVLDRSAVLPVPSARAIRQILGNPPTTRLYMEEDRLKAGLPPIDPLSGLPPTTYRYMIETRLSHGYDEDGRKFA